MISRISSIFFRALTFFSYVTRCENL